MKSLTKSQLLKIFLLLVFLTLLSLTPFISPPMRSPYLYFLLNLLIIVLAIEAGFLSSLSNPKPDIQKKPILSPPSQTTMMNTTTITSTTTTRGGDINMESKPMKRCKSRPSLFFIGSYEEDDCAEKKVEVELEYLKEESKKKSRMVVERGEMMMSKQELFMKAEVFIGNFYKQLKMQREDSWNKLHDFLYHKD